MLAFKASEDTEARHSGKETVLTPYACISTFRTTIRPAGEGRHTVEVASAAARCEGRGAAYPGREVYSTLFRGAFNSFDIEGQRSDVTAATF